MHTPADYCSRYENLTILAPDGGGELATGIAVDRYRLGVPKPAFNERVRIGQKIQKDLAIRRKKDPSAKIVVRVQTADGTEEERSFDKLTFLDDDQLWLLLRYPYGGKGSPEGLQALLQLASVELPGSPAAISPANFQSYCEQWLGLDCNGYVVNYLRHVVRGIDWWDVTTTSGVGPNNLITDIWSSFEGTIRASADEVDFNDLNLLVMVNAAGKIVPGGSTGAGHIMISQPKEVEFDTGLKKALGVPDDQPVPGIYVLESTNAKDSTDGKSGLARSFYAYADYKPQKGVIRVRRGLSGTPLNVRIKGAKWQS